MAQRRVVIINENDGRPRTPQFGAVGYAKAATLPADEMRLNWR